MSNKSKPILQGGRVGDGTIAPTDTPPPPGPGVQQAAIDGWPIGGKNKPEQVAQAPAASDALLIKPDNPKIEAAWAVQAAEAVPAKSPNASVATEDPALTLGTQTTPSESSKESSVFKQVEQFTQTTTDALVARQTTPDVTKPTADPSDRQSVADTPKPPQVHISAAQKEAAVSTDNTQTASGAGGGKAPGTEAVRADKTAMAAAPPGAFEQSAQQQAKPAAGSDTAAAPSRADAPKPTDTSVAISGGKDTLDRAEQFGQSQKDDGKAAASDLQKLIQRADAKPMAPGRSADLEGKDSKDKFADPIFRTTQIEKGNEPIGSRPTVQTDKGFMSDTKLTDIKPGSKDINIDQQMDILDGKQLGISGGAGRVPDRAPDRGGNKADGPGQRTDATQRQPDARGDVPGQRAGDVRTGAGDKAAGTAGDDRLQIPGSKLEVSISDKAVDLHLTTRDAQARLNIAEAEARRSLKNFFGLFEQRKYQDIVKQYGNVIDFIYELPQRSYANLKETVNRVVDAPAKDVVRELAAWAQNLLKPQTEPTNFRVEWHTGLPWK